MKSTIKRLNNCSEKDYVELHTLYTFLCSNIILSCITLLLAEKADSIWMSISSISNLIISFGFVLAIRKFGVSTRLKFAVALFYFSIMFVGMWGALTFAHQIVLFYALFIVLVTTLIFEGKRRTFFLISEISIYISLGFVDLYVRKHRMYIQPVEPRWMLGLLFIITSIIILVYIHNIALERSIEKLKTRAQTDSLTHVGNREALYQTIKSLEHNYNMSQQDYCVVNIDLDEFKYINDTFGHDIGDKVLVKFSNIVSSLIRKTDSIYRTGGDEFILVLRDISCTAAKQLIERLCDDLRSIKSPEINLSFSYGISSRSCSDDEGIDILKLADIRMYEIKRERGCLNKESIYKYGGVGTIGGS